MKKTKNITNGAIILPRSSPNFTQPLFKGAKIFEFNIPRIKKLTSNIKKLSFYKKYPVLILAYLITFFYPNFRKAEKKFLHLRMLNNF